MRKNHDDFPEEFEEENFSEELTEEIHQEGPTSLDPEGTESVLKKELAYYREQLQKELKQISEHSAEHQDQALLELIQKYKEKISFLHGQLLEHLKKKEQ